MFELRNYQEKTIEDLRHRTRLGSRSLLTVAPTGSGKTVLVAFMVKGAASRGKKIWFIVHRRELIKQSIDAFNKVGVSADFLKAILTPVLKVLDKMGLDANILTQAFEFLDAILAKLGIDVPLHFSAFHPDFRMFDHPPTSPSTLSRARKIAMSKRLKYVYTGNVHDAQGGSTYCGQCGTLLIERDWYELGEYNLRNKNECSECGAVCAGVFDDQPGTWGSRRLPIEIE